MFLKKNKGNFAGTNRTANVWNAYAALSVAEKQQLRETAASAKFKHTDAYMRKHALKAKARVANVAKFGAKPYPTFVKANYGRVLHLPPAERFKALGKLWRVESRRKPWKAEPRRRSTPVDACGSRLPAGAEDALEPPADAAAALDAGDAAAAAEAEAAPARPKLVFDDRETEEPRVASAAAATERVMNRAAP
jgi:hypothetical protein